VCDTDASDCVTGDDNDKTKLKCDDPVFGYVVDSDGVSRYEYKSVPAPSPVTTAEPTSAALEHDGEFLTYLHNFFHYGKTMGVVNC